MPIKRGYARSEQTGRATFLCDAGTDRLKSVGAGERYPAGI